MVGRTDFYGSNNEPEMLDLLESNKPSLVVITRIRRIGKYRDRMGNELDIVGMDRNGRFIE